MSFPVFLYLLRSSSIKYPVCYILVSSFLDPRVNRDNYDLQIMETQKSVSQKIRILHN